MTSTPGVIGEQVRGEVENQAPSLTCSRDGAARALTDEEQVSGSRGAPADFERNVISSKLSWEPTETQRREGV